MSLPKDITRNIISEYIEYDELKTLESHVPALYLNPKRRVFKFSKGHYNTHIRTLIIDGKDREEEHYPDSGLQKILLQDCHRVNPVSRICWVLVVIMLLSIL